MPTGMTPSRKHPHPSDRRLRSLRRAGVLVAALAVAASACGGGSAGGGSKADADGAAVSRAKATSVEDAGSGRPEALHDYKLGAEERPIHSENVVSDSVFGAPGFVKYTGNYLCLNQGLAGRWTDFTRSGVPGRYIELFVSWPGRVEKGFLTCSTSRTPIWPATTGPGGGGLSVACPAQAPHVDRRTGGVFFEVDTWKGTPHVTQSSGGYGRNNDGLWNYTFHNWTTTNVTPTIWAVCKATP